MAKTFGENERRICSLFTPGTSFNYRGLLINKREMFMLELI